MEDKVNDVGSERVIGVVGTKDSPRHPKNSGQPAVGMEKLVVGDGENFQFSEEEIFWIPFHPNSDERINEADENLVDDLNKVNAEGGRFVKAEKVDKVKALYQKGENLAGHETKVFDKEENSVRRETFDKKFDFSSAHTPTFYYYYFIFLQSAFYFSL